MDNIYYLTSKYSELNEKSIFPPERNAEHTRKHIH